MPSARAVLFDAYGTLFDVFSVAARAEQLFPGQGQALAAQWRTTQIDYTRLHTLSGRYKPFWDITQDALRYSLKRLNLPADAATEKALMSEYACLSAFPENVATLKQLKTRGLPMGILSNGDPKMLQIAVNSAGMNGLFDWVLSVDAVKQFKTAPAAYALGPAAAGMPAKDILFVSSNGWDACCATWFGYQTLWVNRAGLPLEELGVAPTRVGATLADVLKFFE
ncbi:MAG: haloacid dehalogenase type II [Burkholderiaceae bacterium]